MEPRRIGLIGPVLPYRGGIAQHTTMLHRALRGRADLLTLSFSRQYPSWLFPGDSDRDPSYQNHTEHGVEYLIDSINPLTWYAAIRRMTEFAPALVIFPWWQVYWTICFAVIVKGLKKKDIRVAFLCHNVIEHESASWKQRLTRWVLRKGDVFIVHTREDQENLLSLLPNVQVRRHPHPIYEQFPLAEETLERRAANELLFFGFVRPYKGLDLLLEAMELLKEEDLFLTIAGEFWNGEEQTLERIRRAGLSDRIEVRPRFHTEADTAALFARADVVVLPYRSATGSGVIPLAYHYNKPVIITRVGGLPDVVEEGVTGLIVDPDSASQLASAIVRAFTLRPEPTAFEPIKSRLSWEGFASLFIEEIGSSKTPLDSPELRTNSSRA